MRGRTEGGRLDSGRSRIAREIRSHKAALTLVAPVMNEVWCLISETVNINIGAEECDTNSGLGSTTGHHVAYDIIITREFFTTVMASEPLSSLVVFDFRNCQYKHGSGRIL
jgi:hypothetical protein